MNRVSEHVDFQGKRAIAKYDKCLDLGEISQDGAGFVPFQTKVGASGHRASLGIECNYRNAFTENSEGTYMTEAEASPDLRWPLFLLAFLGAGFGVGIFEQFLMERTGDLHLVLLGAAAYGGGFLIGLFLLWLVYWFGSNLVFRAKRKTTPRRSLAIAAVFFSVLLIVVSLAK